MSIALRLRTDDDTPSPWPHVDIVGWGSAQLPAEEIAGLRRSMPSWAPPNTPNHFFKYADEQTLLSVQAVDNLLQQCNLSPAELTTWGIIAAPHFLGRQATAYSVDQYSLAGYTRISPHVVPQNSLHSISGALSILLATHGPNIGVGGSRDALSEGLFAALTLFDFQTSAGCWLVATGWDPEPLPDRQGLVCTPGVCHAVALAVRPRAEGESRGHLSVTQPLQIFSPERPASVTVADMATQLQKLDKSGNPQSFSWRLPWGALLELELTARLARARRAA